MSSPWDEDQASRPDLFVWRGPVARRALDQWAHERRLRLPQDLLRLWSTTGGGELFESETILAPFGDPALGDDVDSVNQLHHSKGLSSDYLVVHVGSALTVIRLEDGYWIVLDPKTYSTLRVFRTLDEWYRAIIRAEFADRYSLPSEDSSG